MEGEIDVEMRLRWTWKVSENASKIVSKSVENRIKSSFGVVLEHFGPSWRQDGPRCELDRIWGSIWRRLGAHLVAKMAQVGPK